MELANDALRMTVLQQSVQVEVTPPATLVSMEGKGICV